MKLESLTVMFIIFIMPITMILGSYTESRLQTLRYQIQYDTELDRATTDAIVAYKLNSYNSDESNLVNSRMANIQASVNTFFNSVSDNFALSGLNQESLQSYVPAVVFTLYDGYYIYSPYVNTWDQETIDLVGTNDDTYQNGQNLYGLKPYVYYSCRYSSASYDVVITYSLDSYISIKGICDGKVINLSGYLLSDVSENASGNITYRGVPINTETNLQENIMVKGDTEPRLLPCRKINGVKYYYDASSNEVFYVFNSVKHVTYDYTRDDIVNNDNAIQYYRQAYELKQAISTSSLKNIKASDAVDSDGTKLNTKEDYDRYQFDDTKIFNELYSGTPIEDQSSDFFVHKSNVIRYSIEKNLSVAISNYNNYEGANSNVNFKMPELKDYEWESISTNISMITFLQGLSIGGKIYNGYSVVTNNKTEDYVAENSIYILTSDGTYHSVRDEDLSAYNYLNGATGYYNMSFELKEGYTNEGLVRYYYPIEGVMGCYQSIVNKRGEQEGSIYDIVDDNNNLASIYYTALGRERYGMYRTDNEISVEDTSTGGGGGTIEPTPDPINVTYSLTDNGDGTASIEINATSNIGNTITSITNVTQEGINMIDQNHYTINRNQTYQFRIVDSQGNIKTFRVDVGSLKTFNIVPNFEIVSIADDMQSLTLKVTATDSIAGGISSITNITTQNITKQDGSDELYTITANGNYEFRITNINGVQDTASVNIACLGNNNDVDSTIQVDSQLAYNESNNTYLITITANDSQGTIQEITNLTTTNVVIISDRTYQIPNQEASYVFKIVSKKNDGSEEAYFYRVNVPVH